MVQEREGKARQGKAKQSNAREGKARQGKARQGNVQEEKKHSLGEKRESPVLSCHLSSAMGKNHISSSFSGSMCNFPTLNPKVLSGDTLSRLQG